MTKVQYVPESNPNAHEDFIFEDAENFRSAQTQSFKDICLKQYSKCIEVGSQEMNKGGKIVREINGEAIEVVAPNTLELFKNSVEILSIILQPKLQKNKELNKLIEVYDAQLISYKDKLIRQFNGLSPNKSNLTTTSPYKMQESMQRRQHSYRQYEDMIIEYENSINKKKLLVYSYLLESLNYFDEAFGSM